MSVENQAISRQEVYEDWQNDAACHGESLEKFFPEHENQRTTAAAKAICEQLCPVRAECLRHALRSKEPVGVWGGYSTRERNKLIKQATERRRAA
jgi:WhiB family redox-sensing transcriptional regulator